MDVRVLWGQHSGKNQRQNKSDVYLLEVSLKSRIKRIAGFLFFRQVFIVTSFSGYSGGNTLPLASSQKLPFFKWVCAISCKKKKKQTQQLGARFPELTGSLNKQHITWEKTPLLTTADKSWWHNIFPKRCCDLWQHQMLQSLLSTWIHSSLHIHCYIVFLGKKFKFQEQKYMRCLTLISTNQIFPT